MADIKNLKALQIRWADERDIPRLVFLENECFRAYYRQHRFSEIQFADYLRNKQAIFVVATFASSLVGYAAGRVRTSPPRLSVRLDSIAVLPASQQKGVGHRLLQRFIYEARQRNCRTITLEVATPNDKAILFFSSRGFRKIRPLPAYYASAVDGLLMNLDIDRQTHRP